MPTFIDIPGRGRMPQTQLRIGWLWNTPEKFHFHWVVKSLFRDQLSSGNIDFKTINAVLKIDESWIQTRDGEACPVNYPMFLFIWNRYMKHYRKLKPPLLYRLVIKKIGIFVLTLYKEDVAYTSRLGGMVEYILENSEEWAVKEDRLLLIKDLYAWWEEEDWRAYSKTFIRGAFEWIIKHYNEPFVRNSIDFWLDNILANKSNWHDGGGFFSPEKWYPRGSGQVNYIVHGRQA